MTYSITCVFFLVPLSGIAYIVYIRSFVFLQLNNEVELLKERINTYGDIKEEIQVQVKNLDVSIEGIGSVLQANTNKLEDVVERVTTLETQHHLLEKRQSNTDDKLREMQTTLVKTDPTEGKPSFCLTVMYIVYFISVCFC